MPDDAKSEREREKQEHQEHHQVPDPPPHEEEAKGYPTDDRLRSEVPRSGESKT